MSRSIQKTKYHNYLTLTNGCKMVINGAKPLPHQNPQNILTQNVRQVWLSKELPAVCIVDMRNLIQKSAYFNRIGFMCWHQYDSNPKLIEIEYTGQDNPEHAVWVVLTKIRLELASGWQHFKLPLIASKNISYIKLKIMQNHAQQNQENEQDQNSSSDTYLNQASLGYVEEIIESRVELTAASQVNNMMREKTFSDYRKVSMPDKEVKRLAEKVKHLSSDNETMRRTIDHQHSIILKLQEAVQTLVENVGKLQKIQTLQQTKIKQFQKSQKQPKSQHNNESHKKEKLQEFFNDESEIIPDFEEKNHSRKKARSQHNSIYEQHSSQLSKNKESMNKNSKGKSNQKSNQKSNNSKKRYVVNANINQSEESLSEYEGVTDERVYGYRKNHNDHSKSKDENYIPMLEKLQELILLRDEKKNKLKTQKKVKKSSHVVMDDSDGEFSEQSDP